MSYKQFVKLAVLAGAISLDRPSMKTKVMDSPEVLEVIHEMPHIGHFVEALYNCQYQEFFQSLGRTYYQCSGSLD
jgi:26S proteasome regulatory subunit N7